MKSWIIAFSLLMISCQPNSEKVAKEPYLFRSGDVELEARVLHQGKDVIWGFDFLPDGKIIFTERQGRLKIFDPKSSEAIEVGGVPRVAVRNQGGLLDIYLHPKFMDNRIVYLTYSANVGDGMTTVLAQGELESHTLKNLTILFTALPPTDTDWHFGGNGSEGLFVFKRRRSGSSGQSPNVELLLRKNPAYQSGWECACR